MTLQLAISSGKKFRRGTTGVYQTAADFLIGGINLVDYNATDYVTLDVVPATLSANVLMTAWNDAIGHRTSIALAEGSGFFRDFKAKLIASGINVVS